MGKRERHAAILEVIRERRIPNQEALRESLLERGIDVAQATLSRDIRELRLVKVADSTGESHYALPAESRHAPSLDRVLPALFVAAEGTGNLLLLRTTAGGAQPVAEALDAEEWPEIIGTIAGDDTILIVLRHADSLNTVQTRLEKLAGLEESAPA